MSTLLLEPDAATPEEPPRVPLLRRPAVRIVAVALAVVAQVAVVVALVPGNFRLRDLSLTKDDRVEVTSPREGAKVSFPLTITWREKGRVLGGEGGAAYFVVFVDRPPIKPGNTLKGIIDDECEGRVSTPCAPELRAGDPKAVIAHLAENGVHVTKATSLTLDQLAGTAGPRTIRVATIVLVDRWGRRVGESAYSVEFAIEDDHGGAP